jgi:hypothetical protein
MGRGKTALGCAVLTVLLVLVSAPASWSISVPPALKSLTPARTTVILIQEKAKKTVKSCNAGDKRKHHGNAAVNAWAVACEFPPKSEPNPESLQAAAAAAIASGA